MSETPTKSAVFIGIHLAKKGVGVTAVTETGETLCDVNTPYPIQARVDPKGHIEQPPDAWWDATRMALGHMMGKIRSRVVSPSQLKAVSICGEPGILVVLNRENKPLMPAILAEDARANEQLTSLNFHGNDHCKRMGMRFKATDSLAKISWIKENLPELYENATFAHQTDYVLGMLTGAPEATEYSIAQHTGCDLVNECWPDWLDYDMHLGVRERLPRLVSLGEPVGKVGAKGSSQTGLPAGMTVVMGTATATASFLAAGTKRPGDFYTELGDVLAISGMSMNLIIYPNATVKMYKLPGGIWFFSTESNTGGEWVGGWFDESQFKELVGQAESLLPTTYLAYPNVRKGEKFPFTTNSAEGFISPATDNRVVQFASCLQGTAFFERLCYERLEKLAGLESMGDIYSGGPWCADDTWMQIRADVTGRANRRVGSSNGAAFGAAMMAGVGSFFANIEEAAEAMIHEDRVFFPDPERAPVYAEYYENFKGLMTDQGFI